MAILAVQLLMTWWIRRTKLGMGLIAIREDESKAATIGINLPVEKIIAFVASTIFVGMAGAVYGYYLTFIDPRGMFSILISVQIVLSLLLGGKATLWGPVVGAFLIEPLNEIANNSLGSQRRQQPAVPLRRPARPRGDLLAQGSASRDRVTAREAPYPRQGRPGRRPDRHRGQSCLADRPGAAGRARPSCRTGRSSRSGG